MFRSSDAADSGRAHPRCRCAIVAGPDLSPTAFDALFGDSTPSVDRRDENTAALLGNGDAEGVEVPIFSGATPILMAVGAGTGLAAWWVRSRRQPTLAADTHHDS